MKKERQNAILALVGSEEIATQEQLRERLEQKGFFVTQATLSRDVRELQLTKIRGESGRACYGIPAVEPGSIWQNAALRTDYAGNIAVIQCRTGTAQAVAAVLDAMEQEDVVGTIAGDDTIFVLLRTEPQARKFAAEFAARLETGGF